jgi:uncharacterized protein YejL (UPF0352 family)
MNSGVVKRKREKVIDFEAKAAEAKAKRVEDCMNEVNVVLEKYKCDVQCAVEIAGQIVPLTAILNFPNRVQIISK